MSRPLNPETVRSRRRALADREHEVKSRYHVGLRAAHEELRALQKRCDHPTSSVVARGLVGVALHGCDDCGATWQVTEKDPTS